MGDRPLCQTNVSPSRHNGRWKGPPSQHNGMTPPGHRGRNAYQQLDSPHLFPLSFHTDEVFRLRQESYPFYCWEWGDNPKQRGKWSDKRVVDANSSLILGRGSAAEMLNSLGNGGIIGADELQEGKRSAPKSSCWSHLQQKFLDVKSCHNSCTSYLYGAIPCIFESTLDHRAQCLSTPLCAGLLTSSGFRTLLLLKLPVVRL